MRRIKTVLAALVVLVSATGCYHATVETGLAPSQTKVQEDWAAGWLWGLVPPSTVSTAAQCTGGVAKVETYHSFLNMLVQWLTGGIFSPMTISATCAAGGRVSDAASTVQVPAHADSAAVRQAFEEAAERSASTHQDVYVVFSR